MKNFKMKLIWLIIASLSVNALIAIIIVIIGSYSATEWRVLGTAAVVFAYCISIFVCTNHYQKQRQIEQQFRRPKDNRILVYVTATLSLCSFIALILILKTWGVDIASWPGMIWKLLRTIGLTYVSATLIAFYLPRKNQHKVISIVKYSTIGVAGLATALTVLFIWYPDLFAGSLTLTPFMLRFYLIVLVLLVFGTVLTPIIGIIYKPKVVIRFCSGCGKRTAGETSFCTTCGTEFTIDVDKKSECKELLENKNTSFGSEVKEIKVKKDSSIAKKQDS